jgi:predicted aconitase with swiveling domain
LESEFTRELSFNGKFVGSDGAGSSVTINQKTGRISGSVLFSGQKLTIGGVVDQQTGKAFGFFVGREVVAGGIEIVPGK